MQINFTVTNRKNGQKMAKFHKMAKCVEIGHEMANLATLG